MAQAVQYYAKKIAEDMNRQMDNWVFRRLFPGEECRECAHGEIYHHGIVEDPKIDKKHCSYVGVGPKREPCTCQEFVPSDNLKFVEWTYDKRHGQS